MLEEEMKRKLYMLWQYGRFKTGLIAAKLEEPEDKPDNKEETPPKPGFNPPAPAQTKP